MSRGCLSKRRRRLTLPYEAVLFDQNGTLSDDEPDFFVTWTDFHARYGAAFSREDYARMLGTPDRRCCVLMNRRLRLRKDDDEFYEEYKTLLCERLRNARPRPGVERLLRAFKRQKLPLGVVTSLERDVAWQELGFLGIRRRFDLIVTADSKGLSKLKPHPYPYLYAAAKLEVRPENVLVFEDSPTGVRAAKRAGMTVVGVAHALSPPDGLREADLILEEGYEGLTMEMLADLR